MTDSPHVAVEGGLLRFRSLRIVSQDTIQFGFEGVGTGDRVFEATRSLADGIAVVNFDDEFSRLFLGVPCLSRGLPFVRLASQVLAAQDDLLPIGTAWDKAFRECVDEVNARADT